MLRCTLLVVAAAVLLGCQGSPVQVNQLTPDQLADVPDRNVCLAYSHGGRAHIREEIQRRGLVDEQDWTLIDQGQIRIGMNYCGGLAAWGRPAAVNTTTTAHGTDRQWVYERGGYRRAYFYTTGGVIRAIQD